MAEGTWTEVVSASTEPGGGSTMTIIVNLVGNTYSDVYADDYQGTETRSGGSIMRITVTTTGGGTVPFKLPVQPTAAVHYSLVVVARTPQSSGPPTLTEVGPLTGWSGLTWEEAINDEAAATVTVDPHTQPAAVSARLADLADASELWVYRDGEIVFAGPIIGYQPQAADGGLATSIHVRSLWHYPRRWWIEPDVLWEFPSSDQFAIVRSLINYYQGLSYGNVGITVTSGDSGVTRQRTYDGTDNHNIGQRIEELAAVDNGFDFRVDPATRLLKLGVVGTATQVVLDRRNVVDPQAFMSVGPEDLASEGHATGDDISGTRSNNALRERFGRFGVFGAFQGVSVQSTLNDHAQRLVDDRSQMFYEPGPNMIPVPSADVDDFSAGDSIEVTFDYGFSVLSTTRQVKRRQVSVSPTGDETISVQFTDAKSVVRRVQGLSRRVTELEARTAKFTPLLDDQA